MVVYSRGRNGFLINVANVLHATETWDSVGVTQMTLATAEAGKQAILLGYTVGAAPGVNGAPTIQFKSDGDWLTQVMGLLATGSPITSRAQKGVLITDAGASLNLTGTGSGSISVAYVLV